MTDERSPLPEIPKTYSPGEVEERWYRLWEERKLFHADADPAREPYTIVIPPPNITGMLTMGHILNNTLQDIYIRWNRMEGRNACWVPGTDHAGIATQTVVEKTLKTKEGKTRHDLGREEFLKRVWQWRDEYGGIIVRQLRKLGVSCDWDRLVFTMDPELSDAVKEVFIRLYRKGLIYRGKRIINWDPVSHTALSDEEVKHKEEKGKLYYFRYPLMKDGAPSKTEFLVLATTRPETMLGDTAVAVNPHDERYAACVGRSVMLPLMNREIPVIADEYVESSFGTGVVKITPAHDPNDFDVAQRHNLPAINVMTENASINRNGGSYAGQERFVARKRVVEDMEALGLVEKIEDYMHAVGYSDRTDVAIEPFLSDQWFVRMEPLAARALEVVRNGTVRFHPERWVKVYENWMTNIRDWCISRQLWWGHRIPVFYCDDCDWQDALREAPAACPSCGKGRIRQDEDVLDTWFSSWLWPFSVHHWPKDSRDLEYFYPTNLLVTAPDIIFFWVARMIMAGLEFMPEIPRADGSKRLRDSELVPFADVYFTSIIRDEKGRKMSKSLGNSPDPLDVIRTYGADALRFSVIYLAPLGQDVLFSESKCEIGRNFANKIWNAGRFLLTKKNQIESESGLRLRGGAWTKPDGSMEKGDGEPGLEDTWIFSRLHGTIAEVRASLEAFHVNEAAKLLYDFAWHDFCDWYIELIKERLYSPDAEVQRRCLAGALGIFDAFLRLLHPFMPFLTEEIWHMIEAGREERSISTEPPPAADPERIDPETEATMNYLQQIVESVRGIRGEMNIPPSTVCSVVVGTHDARRAELVKRNAHFLERLAKIEGVTAGIGAAKPPFAASAVVAGDDIFVPLEGLIDVEAEKKRLAKETARIESLLKGIDSKLGTEKFVSSAPAEVVEREREKRDTFSGTLAKLRRNLATLSDN